MGFFSELIESFLGTAVRHSEDIYRKSARSYDASDPESVEKYNKAKEYYNQAHELDKTYRQRKQLTDCWCGFGTGKIIQNMEGKDIGDKIYEICSFG